ncbi:MAG: hypothetical protein KC503_39795 [Myxococcales bacterium]|nr:hypothetical protein [Myxococcales bacterium]
MIARRATMIAIVALSLAASSSARGEPSSLAHSSAPLLSADALGHKHIAASVGGGLALMVPSAGLDLAIGAGSRVDLALHYRTYLGFVHSFGYETKVRLYRRGRFALAARLEAAYAFWVTDLVLDLRSEDLPVGNGLTATLGARASVTVRRRVRLSFDLSLTLDVLSVVEVAYNQHEVQGDGRPRAINAGIAAQWMRPSGAGFFMRLTAVVPLRGVYLLGFTPLYELGWSFSL